MTYKYLEIFFSGLECAYDCLAIKTVLQEKTRYWLTYIHLNITRMVTFNRRTLWIPLSTSAKERNPFLLGSNCRKSSSRVACSGALFPIGSFSAHWLLETIIINVHFSSYTAIYTSMWSFKPFEQKTIWKIAAATILAGDFRHVFSCFSIYLHAMPWCLAGLEQTKSSGCTFLHPLQRKRRSA